MVKALWNGVVLAESDRTIVVEGKHYFPRSALHPEFFKPSNQHTTCPWKGRASYYDIIAAGRINPAAACYYPDPKLAASQIRNRVAFGKGVRVVVEELVV